MTLEALPTRSNPCDGSGVEGRPAVYTRLTTWLLDCVSSGAPERLCGLENATAASMNISPSAKMVSVSFQSELFL